MIRIRFEWFPSGIVKKLQARSANPFKVLKQMGPYAYVINLPHDYGISFSFNIEDLVVYKSLTAIPDTPFDEPLFDSIDAPIPMGGVTLCLGGSIEPLDLNYFFLILYI